MIFWQMLLGLRLRSGTGQVLAEEQPLKVFPRSGADDRVMQRGAGDPEPAAPLRPLPHAGCH